MSRVDDLIESYRRFVHLPWSSNLATAQRVWMAVYPPDEERRLRLHRNNKDFSRAAAAAATDREQQLA